MQCHKWIQGEFVHCSHHQCIDLYQDSYCNWHNMHTSAQIRKFTQVRRKPSLWWLLLCGTKTAMWWKLSQVSRSIICYSLVCCRRHHHHHRRRSRRRRRHCQCCIYMTMQSATDNQNGHINGTCSSQTMTTKCVRIVVSHFCWSFVSASTCCFYVHVLVGSHLCIQRLYVLPNCARDARELVPGQI